MEDVGSGVPKRNMHRTSGLKDSDFGVALGHTVGQVPEQRFHWNYETPA